VQAGISLQRVQVGEGNSESRSQNSEVRGFLYFPLPIVIVVVLIVVDSSKFQAFSTTITIATTIRRTGTREFRIRDLRRVIHSTMINCDTQFSF
jgi:hypothetical protein